MSNLPETDRQRRERETTQEHQFFRAWWEGYKMALTKGPAPLDAVVCSDVADIVEREYRERYASTMSAIETIWSGYQGD